MQRVLEDFGFGGVRSMMSADDEGLGAGQFANSLDHSDLRLEIQKAMESFDEVALSSAIDVAREIGYDYPYVRELEKAEAFLFDMLQCPTGPPPRESE